MKKNLINFFKIRKTTDKIPKNLKMILKQGTSL